MNLLHRMFLFVVSTSLVIAPCLAEEKPKTPPELSPDTVAAIVDGKKVTISDIDAEVQRKPNLAMYLQMSQGDPEIKHKVRSAALDAMISRNLLLNAANSSGSINDAEVKKSVADLITKYGGKEKITPMLEKTHTTFEQFNKEVGDDFRISTYLDSVVAKDVQVTEEEIKKTFDAEPAKYTEQESVRPRHILLTVKQGATADEEAVAKKKIDELHAKASAPKSDFAVLAKENSQCPSAAQGGDLGNITHGQTVPEFDKTIFSMKPGEISKPIKTQFGYHIIKLESRKEASKPDLAKSHDAIKNELMLKKKSALVEAKIKDLKAKSKIDIKL